MLRRSVRLPNGAQEIVPVACSEDYLAFGMLKGGACVVQAEPARQLLPTATASDRWLAYASTHFLAHSLLTFAARTISMQPYLLAAVPTQAVGRALPPPPSLVGGAECSQTGGNPPFVAAVTKALTDGATANSVAGSSLPPAPPSSEAAPAGSPILESNLGALQRARYVSSPDRPAASLATTDAAGAPTPGEATRNANPEGADHLMGMGEGHARWTQLPGPGGGTSRKRAPADFDVCAGTCADGRRCR